MNAWINVDKNEPLSSKMTENEITFSAQQEPQSELESDDDDEVEEPEPMASTNAVVQCIEATLKWAESYKNSIRFDITQSFTMYPIYRVIVRLHCIKERRKTRRKILLDTPYQSTNPKKAKIIPVILHSFSYTLELFHQNEENP